MVQNQKSATNRVSHGRPHVDFQKKSLQAQPKKDVVPIQTKYSYFDIHAHHHASLAERLKWESERSIRKNEANEETDIETKAEETIDEFLDDKFIQSKQTQNKEVETRDYIDQIAGINKDELSIASIMKSMSIKQAKHHQNAVENTIQMKENEMKIEKVNSILDAINSVPETVAVARKQPIMDAKNIKQATNYRVYPSPHLFYDSNETKKNMDHFQNAYAPIIDMNDRIIRSPSSGTEWRQNGDRMAMVFS